MTTITENSSANSASANILSVFAEPTPNPATMRFVVNVALVDKIHDFQTAQEAEVSPIAAKLFGFPWTSAVMLGENFIAVTKQDWVDWNILAEPLSGLIREHIENDLPILTALTTYTDDANEALVTDPEIVKAIKRSLNNEIRPVVAMDGGDVVFAAFADGKLHLHMKGACAGCPSKSVTLKEGIEVRLRELHPEILEVVAV